MVRLWAEKEMRNLKRLVTAGIHCPEPIEVKENVLVMSFLGGNGGWYVPADTVAPLFPHFDRRASPRLKDAEIPSSEYPPLYQALILDMRRMYHDCKLVHADLSEYNIIYHDSRLYIIDVSQSVEHDHPAAFDFLRKDIKNVEEYFGRFGVQCLGVRRCFEFITREVLEEGQPEADQSEVLTQWISEAQRTQEPLTEQSDQDNSTVKQDDATHEDNVFLRSYIPRTLNEVYDPERDIGILKEGKGKALIYADTIGLVDPLRENDDQRAHSGNEEKEDHSDTESGISSTASEENLGTDGAENGCEKDTVRKTPRGHRHEDREAKKVSYS